LRLAKNQLTERDAWRVTEANRLDRRLSHVLVSGMPMLRAKLTDGWAVPGGPKVPGSSPGSPTIERAGQLTEELSDSRPP